MLLRLESNCRKCWNLDQQEILHIYRKCIHMVCILGDPSSSSTTHPYIFAHYHTGLRAFLICITFSQTLQKFHSHLFLCPKLIANIIIIIKNGLNSFLLSAIGWILFIQSSCIEISFPVHQTMTAFGDSFYRTNQITVRSLGCTLI